MKSKVLWLYGLLAIGSILLIALGVSYMGDKAERTDSAGNPIPEGIQKVFEQMDSDDNGVITLREFARQVTARAQAAQAQSEQLRLKTLQAQFEAGDQDQDSFIDPAEYAELVIIKQLGDKAPPLSAYDTNEDGKLGFREYITFREQQVAQQPN